MPDPKWLRRLVEDGERIELRTRMDFGWRSKIYDSAETLGAAIHRAAQDGRTCFTTLNRPAAAIRSGATASLADADIEVITRIVFDLDPIRPPGVPSTDAELAGAVQVRDELVLLLLGMGWPMPAVGLSGNGAHVVYRTRLKNTPAWRQHAARLYMAIRDRLSDSCRESGVTFDTTVRNPARIWRIYGIENRKGPATPDRPHRTAEIVLPAGAWNQVPAAVIQRTAETWTPVVQERPQAARRAEFRGSGDYTTLDVVGWFETHGHYRRTLGDGKHAVKCPWDHEHSMPSDGRDRGTVIWDRGESGWPTFHCSHAHCDGRRLVDVIALWGDADAYCSTAWRRDHG